MAIMEPVIDHIQITVRDLGAAVVAPPREYPEYAPAGYYAFFFKDFEGIKYEIVTHSRVAERV